MNIYGTVGVRNAITTEEHFLFSMIQMEYSKISMKNIGKSTYAGAQYVQMQ